MLATTRADYLREIQRLASAELSSGPRLADGYIKRIVGFAGALAPTAPPTPDVLQEFLKFVKPYHQEILWRVSGATDDRRRGLTALPAAALRTLETTPDLLGPLGLARQETAHSRAVAFFLDERRAGDVAADCRKAFVGLVQRARAMGAGDVASRLPEALDLSGAVIHAEYYLDSSSRVDVLGVSSKVVLAIEMKIDAKEGPSQLQRYGQALATQARFSGLEQWLVYVTLDDASPPRTSLPYVHITLDGLLGAWLPVAARGVTPTHRYLAQYLKSIALWFCGVAGEGGFDAWPLAIRRSAIQFVDNLEE